MKKDPRVSKLPTWAQDHIRRIEAQLSEANQKLDTLTGAPQDLVKSELFAGLYLFEVNGSRPVYRPLPAESRHIVISAGLAQFEISWKPEECPRSIQVRCVEPLDIRPEVSNSVRVIRRTR